MSLYAWNGKSGMVVCGSEFNNAVCNPSTQNGTYPQCIASDFTLNFWDRLTANVNPDFEHLHLDVVFTQTYKRQNLYLKYNIYIQDENWT